MAKVIEFYIPNSFHKRAKWIRADQRGEVIELRVAIRALDPDVIPEPDLGEPFWSLFSVSSDQQWN